MNQDNKNLLLAIGLSSAVLLGWNYFYGVPQLKKQQEAAALAQAQTPLSSSGQSATNGQTAAEGASVPGATSPEVALSREDALKQSKRVTLDAPRLKGSIALKGGRIDDVSLATYHETIDPKSANIVLFEPSSAPHPYYAEFGFVNGPGSSAVLPGADTEWQADKDMLTPASPVTLTFDNTQGLVFKRTISIDANYMFDVKDSVENKSAAPVTLYHYALIARKNVPPKTASNVYEGPIGVLSESGLYEKTYADVDKAVNSKIVVEGADGWIGNTDQYWGSALIPDPKEKLTWTFESYGATAKVYRSSVLGEAIQIAPGASASDEKHLFAGAKESKIIDSYADTFKIKLFDRIINWGKLYWITRPLFSLMNFLYGLIGNFGVAILGVTVVVRAVLFPLASRSFQSMAKMKLVQPQMEDIKARFPDDKQKQQQEIMDMYRREKINPVSGCLPMFIQLPIFIGLYNVFPVAIEMRHAPFFGWIKDLSVPDPTHVLNLFGLLPFDPTFLPPFLHIGVWPLIMGFTMFIQMKMNPEPTDPVQKQMFTYMPLIFTFMLGTQAAGLVIYWTWSNVLSVAQQAYISHKAGADFHLFQNLRSLFVKKAA